MPLTPIAVKTYRALLNQTGTSAPVPIIKQNTLGVIPSWTYTAIGQYTITAEAQFPLNKTTVIMGEPTGNYLTQAQNNEDNDSIKITTYNNSSGDPQNDSLYYTYIQIDVYN